MPNTIALKGDFIQKEGAIDTSAVITPGDLVEFVGSGSVKLQPHSTIGGAARKAFALENDLVGKGITDDYDDGDQLKYGVFPPGSEVYANVSEAVNAGDALESAGDGTLVVASTPIEGSIVGWALETVSAPGRCAIEVA